MAGPYIGLDIGSFAVRAVEISVGGGTRTLNRFGQVTLPPGAVREGEILDVAAVSAAIRRLWADGGFKSKRVVLGVANQRVMVRQAEVQLMSEEELRTAIRFEAEELIPIPIDDALLDFQILEEIETEPGVAPDRMRILLVAAQRDMIRTQLAAVEGAGLSPIMVDVVPFALMRSLDTGAATGAEAIVCVGGGVTNVVVHQAGVPRFVRVSLVGADEITERLATELNVDLDTAEDLKRRAGSGPGTGDALEARAAQIVQDRIAPLANEIQGTLEYFIAQPDSAPVDRVLLTGGGIRTPGLIDQLERTLERPLEIAHPLTEMRVGKTGLSDAELQAVEPLLAVPLGLAMAAVPLPGGGRRMSLLPTEISATRVVRRQAYTAAAAVGIVTLGLGALWVAKGNQVDEERARAERTEARAAALRIERNRLADVTALDNELNSRREEAARLLATDVAWTRFLQELAVQMPANTWLASFSGNAQDGAVTFSVGGQDFTDVARWLLRIAEMPSITSLWVPSATQADGVATFSSDATLTPAARSDRASQYAEEAAE